MFVVGGEDSRFLSIFPCRGWMCVRCGAHFILCGLRRNLMVPLNDAWRDACRISRTLRSIQCLIPARRQSKKKPEGTASSSGKGVDKASREDGKEEECRLFIGQFDRDVSSAQLEKIFSAYGEVVECRVLQDKGIGFVSYARDSEAKQAVQDLHLQCVPGISRGEGFERPDCQSTTYAEVTERQFRS